MGPLTTPEPSARTMSWEGRPVTTRPCQGPLILYREAVKPRHWELGVVQAVAGPDPASVTSSDPSGWIRTARGLCRPEATTTGAVPAGCGCPAGAAAWLGATAADRLPTTAAARKAPAQDLPTRNMSLLSVDAPAVGALCDRRHV